MKDHQLSAQMWSWPLNPLQLQIQASNLARLDRSDASSISNGAQMSDSTTQPNLIRDFLLSPSDLFSLADTHNLSLDALIAWWSDPATKARIRAIEEIAESRRDLRAKLHSIKAIDRLSALCESNGNQPHERRHCANSLLKHSPSSRAPKKQSPRQTSQASSDLDPAISDSAAQQASTSAGAMPTALQTQATQDALDSHRSHRSYESHTTYSSLAAAAQPPSTGLTQHPPVQSSLNAPPRDQGRSPTSIAAAAGRDAGAAAIPTNPAALGGAATPPNSVLLR